MSTAKVEASQVDPAFVTGTLSQVQDILEDTIDGLQATVNGVVGSVAVEVDVGNLVSAVCGLVAVSHFP